MWWVLQIDEKGLDRRSQHDKVRKPGKYMVQLAQTCKKGRTSNEAGKAGRSQIVKKS